MPARPAPDPVPAAPATRRSRGLAMYRVALTSRVPWIAAVGLVVLHFTLMIAVHYRSIHLDNAMYAQAAQLILEGRLPYVDFYEVNPPLIMYLNLPHVYLAGALGLPAALTFMLFVGALLIVCTALAWRALGAFRGHLSRADEGVLLAGWALAAYALQTGFEHGQREQLFMLLYFPFLVIRAARYEGVAEKRIGRPLAVTAGIFAGIGLAIKPHYLAMGIAVDLLCAFRARRFIAWLAPEAAAALGVILLYAAHWMLVPAAMREAFFGRWAPFVWKHYAVYGISLEGTLGNLFYADSATLALLGVACAAGIAARLRATRAPLLGVAISVTAVGLGAFILQRKGWANHAVVFRTGATVAFAAAYVAVTKMLRHTRVKALRFELRLFPLAFTFVLGLTMLARLGTEGAPKAPPLQGLELLVASHTLPRDPVLVVNSSPYPTYPMLLMLDRRPGTRYLFFFSIPMLYEGVPFIGNDAQLLAPTEPEITRRIVGEMREDLTRFAPKLILIYAGPYCQACIPGLNLNRFLDVYGLHADIRAGYDFVPSDVGDWLAFVRKSGSR